jgi:hypothetical protein
MPDRISLTLPPGKGHKEIAVDLKRFSIGRIPGNDLVIDDPSLSRRHSMIENFDGRPYLSDCGSSNGTFLNDTPVNAAAELHDGDELRFGGVGNIIVNIRADEVPVQSGSGTALPAGNIGGSPQLFAQQGAPGHGASQLPSAPVLATAAVVIILLIAGLILILANSSNTSGPVIVRKPSPVVENDNGRNISLNNTSNSTKQSTPEPTAEPTSNNNSDPAGADLSMVEGFAGKVLTSISKDKQPVLAEKSVREINARVQRYRGSAALAEELRTMKRNLPQVATSAKNSRVKTPLAVYATLARMDQGGTGGDMVQTAAQLCPALERMSGIFGQELANDTLLALAGLDEGADLQLRLSKLAGKGNESPTTIRSIWYLHEHQAISDRTYDFLLRFLAIGVISQDPQKFGIAAEPLSL